MYATAVHVKNQKSRILGPGLSLKKSGLHPKKLLQNTFRHRDYTQKQDGNTKKHFEKSQKIGLILAYFSYHAGI